MVSLDILVQLNIPLYNSQNSKEISEFTQKIENLTPNELIRSKIYFEIEFKRLNKLVKQYVAHKKKLNESKKLSKNNILIKVAENTILSLDTMIVSCNMLLDQINRNIQLIDELVHLKSAMIKINDVKNQLKEHKKGK